VEHSATKIPQNTPENSTFNIPQSTPSPWFLEMSYTVIFKLIFFIHFTLKLFACFAVADD